VTARNTPSPPLYGIDFTSAPTRRKPITVAHGVLQAGTLQLQHIDALHDFAAFEQFLRRPGPWLAAFDFPFGLPREFVEAQALGDDIDTVIHTLQQRCATRMDFRALIDAWGNGRAAGQRLIHRHCDRAEPGVSSTSPLQTRYVPVGFMFFEGLARLVQADVQLPQMRMGDPSRVALEGYPGLLAFELVGRHSYKNGDTPAHREARALMLQKLQAGETRLGLQLILTKKLHRQLLDDVAGDWLDAVLCLMQAAWASRQPAHGLPADVDPVEGWIVSAGAFNP
jgi:Protein of unknown function (DUF429)